jgi:sigma-B regulation protein RsbU (phosphoserine phosphatase)
MAMLRILRAPPGCSVPTDIIALDPNVRTLLGRGPDCHIELNHTAVSRPHAQIEVQGNQYYLQDLGSLNGTRVNGQPITRRRLRNQDHIKICGFHLLFLEEPSSDSAVILEPDESSTYRQVATIDVGLPSEVQSLSNADAKLRALLALTAELGTTIDLLHLLPRVMDIAFRTFEQAERGAILLYDEPGSGSNWQDLSEDTLSARVAKRRDGRNEPFAVSRRLIEQSVRHRKAILSTDALASAGGSLSPSRSRYVQHSVMCAPLLTATGHVLGVIELEIVDIRKQFSPQDLDVLAAMAQQVGNVVELSRLHEIALREQENKLKALNDLQRIEHDLELARRVQQNFLPRSGPHVPGYDFFVHYQPFAKVGGDCYHYAWLPDGRLAVLIADVLGDGMPAALLMARFIAEARYLLARQTDLVGVLGDLNRSFHSGDARFVTALLAAIDVQRHRVEFLTAGHWPPLLRRRSGQVQVLDPQERTFAVGMFAEASYERGRSETELAPGDSVVLFTDGIPEARDDAGHLYTLDRMIQRVASAPQHPQQLGPALLDDVAAFSPQLHDDVCLVVFGRTDHGVA